MHVMASIPFYITKKVNTASYVMVKLIVASTRPKPSGITCTIVQSRTTGDVIVKLVVDQEQCVMVIVKLIVACTRPSSGIIKNTTNVQ